MADLIFEHTNQRVTLVPGGRGEFTVWVGPKRVAGKSAAGFPEPAQVLVAVQQTLEIAE